MKKFRAALITDNLRAFTCVLVGGVIAVFLLWFQLGKLTPGLSNGEAGLQKTIATQSLSGRAIAKDPLYLPYKLGLYSLEKVGKVGQTSLRSIGAFFGLLAVVGLFIILREWHTLRSAVLGTALFATSAWFLHSSRLADLSSSYLLIAPFIATLVLIRHHPDIRFVWWLAFLLAGFLLYLPGMVWLIFILAVWQWRTIGKLVIRSNLLATLCLMFGVVIFIGPLVRSFVLEPNLLITWLGFPANIPTAYDYIRQLALVPWRILIRGPLDPAIWVGRAGLLDAFAAAMVVLGCYSYFFRYKLDRVKLLIGALCILVPLVALGGPVTYIVLLPFMYILVTAGFTLLLQQWFTVFPRNPVARGLALLMICGCVIMACFYNLQHYFVAWPRTPETKNTFQVAPVPQAP